MNVIGSACAATGTGAARSKGARHPFAPRIAGLLVATIALLAAASCRTSDPVEQQKTRALTPDERYLVDYYMKIIQFEKQHYDNPALREEKKQELAREFDRERIERAIAKLEKKPEGWLAIYNRINELQIRELQNPTAQY